MLNKAFLGGGLMEPPAGQYHFIASKAGTNVNFFNGNGDRVQLNSSVNLSNLNVYINDELTEYHADSISFAADDKIIIKAQYGTYPPIFIGRKANSNDYIKSIEEPFPEIDYSKCTGTTDYGIDYGSYMFANLQTLVSIPEQLLINNPSLDTFEYFFAYSNIPNIPTDLFSYTANEKYPSIIVDIDITGLFRNSTGIDEHIDEIMEMFKRCRGIGQCSRLFQQSDISTIPSNLFADTDMKDCTDISYMFQGCAQITSIPQGLLDSCTKLQQITSLFSNTNVTHIPENLFANNSDILLCNYLFSGTPITSVPSTLFVNFSKAYYLNYCFENCSNLANVPINLFANCTNAMQYMNTFKNCSNLTLEVIVGNSDSSITRVTNFAYGSNKGVVYCDSGNVSIFNSTSSANVVAYPIFSTTTIIRNPSPSSSNSMFANQQLVHVQYCTDIDGEIVEDQAIASGTSIDSLTISNPYYITLKGGDVATIDDPSGGPYDGVHKIVVDTEASTNIEIVSDQTISEFGTVQNEVKIRCLDSAATIVFSLIAWYDL